ncbi:MAG TPA: DUF58 domain-containing protein [Polyangiaceae bacterium]|nr:DUF58 domain-containing protein [Polyangiaceae bacterium]
MKTRFAERVGTLDWGKLAPLRLRARAVAEGVFAGAHRSRRRGSGVEFGGHRSYVPGDDLRFLDRRATMRHGKLLVRQFETETDRGLRLVIDASKSMAYRSEGAPGAKLAFAALIGAALCRVALASADTISLDFIGGDHSPPLPAMGGLEAFERLTEILADVEPSGDASASTGLLDVALDAVARRSRRGTAIVVLSDFIDLPDGAAERLMALSSGGRVVVGVRVLDPAEASFPFVGPVLLRASEGGANVETDAASARAGYLAALAAKMTGYRERLVEQGGRFVEVTTSDDPVLVVQSVLAAIGGTSA